MKNEEFAAATKKISNLKSQISIIIRTFARDL